MHRSTKRYVSKWSKCLKHLKNNDLPSFAGINEQHAEFLLREHVAHKPIAYITPQSQSVYFALTFSSLCIISSPTHPLPPPQLHSEKCHEKFYYWLEWFKKMCAALGSQI